MDADKVEKIFDGRNKFIIVGLTGRTGSGCSTAAGILSHKSPNFPTYHDTTVEEETFYSGLNGKRYNIVKKYASHNWSPFFQIKVSDVIGAYFVRMDLNYLCEFIYKNKRDVGLSRAKIRKFLSEGYYSESLVREKHSDLLDHLVDGCVLQKEYSLSTVMEFSRDIGRFNRAFKNGLDHLSNGLYVYVYQAAGDSIRKTGRIDVDYNKNSTRLVPDAIFTIPETINRTIKIYRQSCKYENKPAYIVIDAIRNPLEARFFRDRYSAFYLISVNAPDDDRKKYLQSVYKFTDDQISDIDKKESGRAILEMHIPESQRGDYRKVKEFNRNKKEFEWISQNVKRCIEMSDIHLFNPKKEKENNNVLSAQLAWYFALILHPGLISPTSIERVMQIAYTAKANSGCISRQVGAVITDDNFSIKSVGWNDVAEGQYPCSLRSVEGVLHQFDDVMYSGYEQNDKKFRDGVRAIFSSVITTDGKRLLSDFEDKKLRGRPLSYCFKDIKNHVSNEHNQVHTRSLHAEENAFLQITKYGGQGIQGGKLFTTASPCELCAKKAYQLGIKEIIYIDPYPGIAREHILDIGTNKPKLMQFRGAVGRAYHMLYEPIMAYKDELSFLL